MDGDPAYYEELGKTLDEKMRGLMDANDCVTVTGAAVLTALDYLDELHRSNDGADNLRSQLKSYFEDAMSAKATAENAARELQELRDRLAACIAAQDYETCAELRDKIRALEGGEA